MYIGTPDNEQFLGAQDPQALAEHISVSIGPSGFNRDYLLELEKALDDLSLESGDGHIKDLASRLRAFEAQQKGRGILDENLTSTIGSELKRVSSTDEQEEVEK